MPYALTYEQTMEAIRRGATPGDLHRMRVEGPQVFLKPLEASEVQLDAATGAAENPPPVVEMVKVPQVEPMTASATTVRVVQLPRK